MSLFENKPLGTLAKYINGRNFKPSDWGNEGLPIIRIANLNKQDAPLDYYNGQLDDGHRIDSGDIVVSWSATLDAFQWNRGPAALNQHIFKVIPRKDVVNPEYLFFVLKQAMKGLAELVHGATMKHVTRPEFENFEVRIQTDCEKQRQIATRLKAQLAEVDKARQAAEAQLQDAHKLYTAVLRETFLNIISSTWPRIELGEVGDVVAGFTLGRKTNGKATRSIPYLRVANVKDGYLDLSDVSTIQATDAEIERLLLQPGDILLTEGGDLDKLGRGTFWSGELNECIHQNHIFRVRFPSDSYLPEFIAAQIGSTYGKNYFFAHAKKTTGIATINQKVLKGFPVLSPTIEIQKNVMGALSSRLDEAGRIIKFATKQINDINLLPQKILAQVFEM